MDRAVPSDAYRYHTVRNDPEFPAGIFVSLLLSTLLWFSRQLSEILEPYLVLLNSLPKSALAPLFIVWLGTGINTIIIAGISVAVFGSIISFYTAFHQVDPEKEILIRTLGGNRRDIFSKWYCRDPFPPCSVPPKSISGCPW